MNRTEALTEVLHDVTRPESDRAIARAALNAANANATSAPASDLLQELLVASNKPLSLIPYFEVHAFCTARGWQAPSVQELFDRWRDAHFLTQAGRKDAERIAEYLRDHDLDELGYALELWKDSAFKDSSKLTDTLQRITANRGSIHATEAAEQAGQFLDELKRRTPP
jgi:hypothetical protein